MGVCVWVCACACMRVCVQEDAANPMYTLLADWWIGSLTDWFVNWFIDWLALRHKKTKKTQKKPKKNHTT